MSYKYSKGAQVIGDLKAADDTERNTLIDFGEDQIDFQTSGSVRLQISNDGVYIPDSPQAASLFVSGGIQLTPGNQEGIRFTNKGNNELNFISFQEGDEGGSFNARLGYNSAEYIFISPGRAGDFFVNSAESSGDFTYSFSIMDDGTAKFTKGLLDPNVRAADLTGSTAFYVSGSQDGQNNAIFLSRVGIGTEAPAATLDISGSAKVQSDLSVVGQITAATQPAFLARKPSNNQDSFAINTGVDVTLSTEDFDVGSNFASNTFTAPTTGVYIFTANVYLTNLDVDADSYALDLVTTAGTYRLAIIDPGAFSADVGEYTLNGSMPLLLTAGDTAKIQVYQLNGTQQTNIRGSGTRGTFFAGYLLG